MEAREKIDRSLVFLRVTSHANRGMGLNRNRFLDARLSDANKGTSHYPRAVLPSVFQTGIPYCMTITLRIKHSTGPVYKGLWTDQYPERLGFPRTTLRRCVYAAQHTLA